MERVILPYQADDSAEPDPATPDTFLGLTAVENIGATSAKLVWSPVALVTQYVVYEIRNGAPVEIVRVAQPTSSYTLTNLAANTSFTYRVQAVYSDGRSDININDKTFSTLSDSVRENFSGLSSVQEIGATSAKLIWTPVSFVTEYIVYVVVSGTATEVTRVAHPGTFYVASSLSPATAYTYRVRAVYSDGRTDTNTTDRSFTTLTNFAGLSAVQDIGSTSAKLVWAPISLVSEYVIYSVVAGSATEVTRVAHPAGNYTLPALSPNTGYAYRVRAVYTDARTDTNTTDRSFTTLEDFAGLTSVQEIGATSAKLSWTTIANVSQYAIYSVTNGSATEVTRIAHPAANYTVTNLTHNTAYTYRVRAIYSDARTDSNTVDRSFTTLANFLGLTSVQDVGASTATLSWATVAQVSQYVVYSVMSGTATEVARVAHPGSTYALTSLSPTTTYTYRVRAIYTDGRTDTNTTDRAFTTLVPPYVQATYTYDFSDTSKFAYDAPKLSMSGQKIKLIKTSDAVFTDNFDDGITTPWSSVIAYSGSRLTSMAESNSIFDVRSTGLILGLPYSTVPSLTKATATVSVTPRSFSGTPLIGIMARQTGSAYYMGSTYGSKHRLMYNNGTSLAAIGSIVDGPALVLGTTYNMKMMVDGSTLKYKMWVDGTSEPGWLVTGTNTFLSSGKTGVVSAGGESEFEYFETLDDTKASSVPLYQTGGVAIRFPELVLSAVSGLQSYDKIEVDAVSASDSYLKYELSTDSGATWVVPSGGSWVTNSSGVSGAATLAAINASIGSLAVTSKKVVLRIYLVSTDGTHTPEINSVSFLYTKTAN